MHALETETKFRVHMHLQCRRSALAKYGKSPSRTSVLSNGSLNASTLSTSYTDLIRVGDAWVVGWRVGTMPIDSVAPQLAPACPQPGTA
jgi:hypothetical protein